MNRPTRAALTAAGALAIAAVGAGAGAGIYAAVANNKTETTTVVENTTTVDHSQPASASSGMSINALYQKTYQGVVDITVTESSSASPFGGSETSEAEGSGIVYDSRGDIVTNDHVVTGATSVRVRFWNGTTLTGHVIGTDVSTDLAVVRVNAPAGLLHPLTFGDSSAVQVGDTVIAIGSPFGLAETVTNGIVSALDRTMQSPTTNANQNGYTIGGVIQTDAAINHGNSGGPLIDSLGQVIGINAQIQSESGGSEGVGLAIPSNTVTHVVTQLIAGQTVKHAYMGIEVGDSTSPAGALAQQVIPGGAAAKAGLKSGDVIIEMNGAAIASTDDLSSVIDVLQPGNTISVTFVRAGRQHTVKLTLGERPPSS
jgi:putative serine protease PepD